MLVELDLFNRFITERTLKLFSLGVLYFKHNLLRTDHLK